MTDNLHELPSAWKLAIQREQAAHDYYLRMAHTATDAAARTLFQELAKQEARHKELLVSEYERVFEADMDQPAGRVGTFEHDLHSDSPMGGFSWWPWEEDTFRLARELDVPILLDIGATWCHWCHEMDKTYRDPQVSSLIGDSLIAIRVDTDERPDINARYNMGGWPTTAFLTPDGEPLTGATYLTPDQFIHTAQQVIEYYRTNKGRIGERMPDVVKPPAFVGAVRTAQWVTPGVVDEVLASITDAFDPVFGGLGAAPKFPHPDALMLALDEAQRTGDASLREHLHRTLRHMVSGGLFDPVEGGFFRYATARDWSAPHYEKIAEDNAQLIDVYLAAADVLGDEEYLKIAGRVADYFVRTLWDPQGFFRASQDADQTYYGLDAAGRSHRTPPFVDKTLFAGTNAILASTMLRAGLVLDRRELTDDGLKALDTLWTRLYHPGTGLDHFVRDGQRAGGMLADQVHGAMAMLDAYERVGDPRFLSQAQVLMEFVLAEFSAGEGAGFHDLATGAGALGRLRQRETPIRENAIAAQAALRLHALTGAEKYRRAAESALAPFAASFRDYSFGAARYATAAHALLTLPVQIIIVGTGEDPVTDDLRRAALRAYAPNRVLQVVDPAWEPDRLSRLGYPAEPPLRAYVCSGLECLKPTDRPEEISAIVERLVSPWKSGPGPLEEASR